jgi:alkylhydroperoxidase/carboxymuconolactone decarboxylase family protein YurZ
MKKNSFLFFQEEFPELAARFNDLIEAQKSVQGLDAKTKQIVNIAIQTANKNSLGVKLHAQMANHEGASIEEVKNAVVMNLHLSGLSSVLECLPAAIEGFEMGNERD